MFNEKNDTCYERLYARVEQMLSNPPEDNSVFFEKPKNAPEYHGVLRAQTGFDEKEYIAAMRLFFHVASEKHRRNPGRVAELAPALRDHLGKTADDLKKKKEHKPRGERFNRYDKGAKQQQQQPQAKIETDISGNTITLRITLPEGMNIVFG